MKLNRNSVEVFDDFLDPEEFYELEKLVRVMKWHYTGEISAEYIDRGSDPKLDYGFDNTIFDLINGDQYQESEDLIDRDDPLVVAMYDVALKCKKKFNFDRIIRCRGDMTTYRGEDPKVFSTHVDCPYPHFTTILYMNESDAPTIIYNEKWYNDDNPSSIPLTEKIRILPKPNRLAVFYGNHIHTGMAPRTTGNRILININYTSGN